MKTVKLIIDGKEIEAQVNEEDLEQIKKKLYVGRQSAGEKYFYLQSNLEPTYCVETLVNIDEDRYNSGNYFLTEKECADAARVVSLWLRMKRFANKYNKENFKFTDAYQEKYFIIYDFASEFLRIDLRYNCQDMFQIYFDNEETAQKAIDEFHDDLIWYFTEYEKGNKTANATSKEIQYEVNVGSGCANGTVFVDKNATDEEIRLEIMDDLYDVNYREVKE